MIDLEDIRQDIFDIKKVPKVLYVYRGDTFEVDLELTISSSELNSVVLNCDGLPEATPLTLLETTTASSKWHLLLNKSQTLILAPKNHDFTITIVRTDGTELTLYKGIMTVNNRVYSNYSNNYYIATLLKQRAPTVSDNDYLIGTMWVNVLTDRVYFLTSVVNNEAKWIDYSGDSAQVDAEIFIIVATLPTTGVANKIYLVPSTNPDSQNTLDEWLWVNNNWELIGGISIDLNDFFTKAETEVRLFDILQEAKNYTKETALLPDGETIVYDSEEVIEKTFYLTVEKDGDDLVPSSALYSFFNDYTDLGGDGLIKNLVRVYKNDSSIGEYTTYYHDGSSSYEIIEQTTPGSLMIEEQTLLDYQFTGGLSQGDLLAFVLEIPKPPRVIKVAKVDGNESTISIKRDTKESLENSTSLVDGEIVYALNDNVIGIYDSLLDKIHWQVSGEPIPPIIPGSIIRVRGMSRSDGKLEFPDGIPTIIKTELSTSDIIYYTNETFDNSFPYAQMVSFVDSFGNEFIEIPPIYVKEYKDTNDILLGYDLSSEKLGEDYVLYPNFIHKISGAAQPARFGKYMGTIVDGLLVSKPGYLSTLAKINTFRTAARANGDGYYQNDKWNWQIIQLLMWTYFGDLKIDRWFPDRNYSEYLPTGQMDNVPHKVAYNKVTGLNTFFGIENILKDKKHFVDGVLTVSTTTTNSLSVARDFRNYRDTTNLNYDTIVNLPTSNGYIVSMGSLSGVSYPKNVVGGSSTTFYSDYYEKTNRDTNMLVTGSSRSTDSYAGVSLWSNDDNVDFATAGSRLMFSSLEQNE